VTKPVLPLHEATAEPLHAAAEAIVDPDATESTAEPLHVDAESAAGGAAPTETSCLCVWV
jgi:hypothetical protein